jgi:hypothetical protein
MHIVTLVPEESLQRLCASVPGTVQITPVGLATLSRVLNDGHPEIVVCDPCWARPESFTEIVGVIARAGVPLLLYGRLSRVMSARVATAAAMMTSELLFQGAPDETEILRRVIRSAAEPCLPALIFARIAQRVHNLPAPLAERVVSLFGWLAIPNRVSAFVAGLPFGARTVRELLARAGLSGPKRLIIGARVARAFEIARAKPGLSLDALGELCGLVSAGVLDSQCRLVTGLAGGAALRRGTRDALVEAMTRRLTRPAGTNESDSDGYDGES